MSTSSPKPPAPPPKLPPSPPLKPGSPPSLFAFLTKLSILITLLLSVLIASSPSAISQLQSFSFNSPIRPQLLGLVPTEFRDWINEGLKELDYWFGEEDSQKLRFEDWVSWQELKSWNYLLENINPPPAHEGETVIRGTVVASPSNGKDGEPDYWYQWTRDSALVMRTVGETFMQGREEFGSVVEGYLEGTEFMQHQETLIGSFHSGGLGEVKYHVNGTPFLGEWSRPQPDGPAARVITITKYANWVLDGNGKEKSLGWVKEKLWGETGIVKGDLDYLMGWWRDAGFDLWEEVSGSHFYTLLSIQSAFSAGSLLASRLGDEVSARRYLEEVRIIKEEMIPQFWSEEKEIVRVSMNFSLGRDSEENAHKGDDSYGKSSELDIAVILAALHSGEGTEWIGSPKLLSTLSQMMDAFSSVYPLNSHHPLTPALGRYPEDLYDGTSLSLANPWYLATLAAAEYIYRTVTFIDSQPLDYELDVGGVSWKFYKRFLPAGWDKSRKVGRGENVMEGVLKGMRKMGDGFLEVVKGYVEKDGRMAEQFHRETGEPRGARDLTWSYAAFITAAEARRGGRVSWGLPPEGGFQWRKMGVH